MSTTRRVIRKAPTVKKVLNRKNGTNGSSSASMSSLPEEIQLEILVHAPFERFPQLRLVCSQWSKILRSDAFGRELCIKQYGNDIAPLRIQDLAQHPDASDSELFLIPTKTQGGSLSVDWLKYFELRTLFERYRRMWALNQLCNYFYLEKKARIPTSSELSYVLIKTMLDYHSAVRDQVMDPQLLLELIPLLVQYKRIEVARSAVAILAYYEKHDYLRQSSESISSTVRLVSGCLDVLELSSTHFPGYTKKLMNIIVEHTRFFTEDNSKGRFTSDSASFYRHVFKRVIVAMIHEGARGSLQTTDGFLYFYQPWDGCYQIILRSLSTNPSYKFLELIVPTCRDTFKNSTDWRVRASALAVSHVADADTDKSADKRYLRDKLSFALAVIQEGDVNHNEVLRAAFMSIYFEVKCMEPGNRPMEPRLFKSFFNCFVDAIGFLPINEKPMALTVLKRFMRDFNNGNYADEMLDQLHKNIFSEFLQPNVINSTKEYMHTAIIKGILEVCAIIKQRGQEYLPCYETTLRNLAKSAVPCPEAWLALYIDVGCLMGSHDFLVEARDTVKKIEANEFDFGVPIRMGHFLACCKSAQKLSSTIEDQLIESVLSVFPPYVLDVLDPIVVDEDVPGDDEPDDDMSLPSDGEAEHQEDEAMEIDTDVNAVLNGPLIDPANDNFYKKAPSYLPYNKKQWTNAVESLAKPRSNPNKLFTFEEPKGNFEAMPDFIQQLDMSTRKRIDSASLTVITSTPEAEGAIEKIIQWCKIDADVKKETVLKFTQRFLHVMIARLMSGPVIGIKARHVECVSYLIETLEPHLDDNHLTRYLTSVIDSLSTEEVSYCCTTRLLTKMKEFQDSVFSMLGTRVPDVDSEFLIVMLRFCRHDNTRNYRIDEPYDVMLRVKCLDILTNLYPRASWTAFRSNTMLRYPFCNTDDDESSFIQQLFQVKLFGMRGLAQLTGYSMGVMISSIKILLDEAKKNVEIDPVLQRLVPKLILYCRLCKIDPEIGELNSFNQYLFDQRKIKRALVKAEQCPGEMKYYSELLF